MNNRNLKFIVLAIIGIFSLISCSDDDAPSESNGVTTGNYFPLASGNIWQYELGTNENGNTQSISSISISETIKNITYYRLSDSEDELNLNVWMSKRGASYYQKTSEALIPSPNGQGTIEIGEFEIKMFRDDLNVGEVWRGSSKLKVRVHNGSSPQSVPAKITYTGTIMEKGATETLGTITYTDIIKMKLEAIETVGSESINIDAEYWFAKDIGLIKETTTSTADNITRTKYLLSYSLN